VLGVVIPARDAAATLQWTVLSLLAQRGISVRVVVVDSESTDGTLRICESWNLPVLSVPPGNMYRAVNRGMTTFETPWLTYLNSDDLVYADGYSRLIHHGEAGGFDVVYGDVDFIDWQGRYLYSQATFRPGLATRLLVAGVMSFAQPAAIFRRDVFDRLRGFDERFRYIADHDFYSRAASAGFRFGKAPGPPVAAFRVHGGQLSTASKKALDVEKEQRRREGARGLLVTRIGLGLLWQMRNSANYWAGFKRRRAATALSLANDRSVPDGLVRNVGP
jgi:glycosyltransferase involved in cell wall biosynthesis